MDSFTLNKVEFDRLREILSGFCLSALGRELTGRITPSRNPDVIAQWQDQTAQMVDAIRQVGIPPFAGARELSGPLSRAHPGRGATGEDFATIAAALEAAGNVRAYLEGLPESLSAVRAAAENIGRFDAELQAIRGVVGPDGTILDDASEHLANVRGKIAETARQIHDVIHGYLRRPDVAKLLQNPTVTLHADRYVLPVKVENRGRLAGVVHRASNTGATVFVEPNECVELNNRLTDLADDERREVQRLLNALAIRVQERAGEISSALRQLAQVDLMAAKAQYAYQFDMVRPELSENGALELRQARHPLLMDQAWRQEKAGVEPAQRHAVVPIDVRLGEDFDLLVITGSNTGGKTVTLKTVALMALMSQSGLHIPAARGSKMPIYRDVLIDIGDEQSLEQSLSTFGAHIKRIHYILRKAGRTSLVLLDELGAGTDPEEGGAIGQAILDELRPMGCHGMVTTHLSVLKAYAYNHDRVDNASVEFDTETLSPTYHLHIGKPGESHAITVARKLGMPKRLIGSARKHLTAQGQRFRKAIRATGKARQAAEVARSEAQTARVEAQTRQEAYQSKLADLHQLQEDFRTWLARLPELRPGDEVFVPSMNKTGRLARLELHRQVALVDVDSMQVEVPLGELMPDLGQGEVRKQIGELRRKVLEQARQAEQERAEAERMHKEFQKSLAHQNQRARQFDQWLAAIGRVKVGAEVPIAKAPGKGKVTALDFRALKATVRTERGEVELSLQDLFPQTGPFAPSGGDGRGKSGRKGKGRGKGKPRGEKPDNRPMHRGKAAGRSRGKARTDELAASPGDQVFVIPFHKRATLIRIDADKRQAVVQSGAFEMELPLTDVEPVPSS